MYKPLSDSHNYGGPGSGPQGGKQKDTLYLRSLNHQQMINHLSIQHGISKTRLSKMPGDQLSRAFNNHLAAHSNAHVH